MGNALVKKILIEEYDVYDVESEITAVFMYKLKLALKSYSDQTRTRSLTYDVTERILKLILLHLKKISISSNYVFKVLKLVANNIVLCL